MVSLERMRRVLDVDCASGLVRVQAGITINELSQRLDAHGLAMENLGDIDVQSIAGAISTATHGTGARLRNISAQVAGLKLVLADGSTLECDAEREPEVFAPARVGLGALGVIAEVTLRCVPAFTLRGIDAPAPLAQTLERFDRLALSNDHFEFFVFPYADVALTRTNNRTDDPPRPRGRLAAYANDVLLTNHAFGLFCRVARRLPGAIPPINRLVTRLAGRSRARRTLGVDLRQPAAGALHRDGVRAASRAHARGGAARDGADRAARPRRAVPDRGAHGRPATTPFSSTAAGRDSGLSPCTCSRGWSGSPYFEAVEAIMDELRRPPALGQAPLPDGGHAAPALPRLGSLPGGARAAGPGRLFANAWTDRVLGPVGS